MTWAARYSRTEQPELTIWRDGRVEEHVTIERAGGVIQGHPCNCLMHRNGWNWIGWDVAAEHDLPLRADIAARVPVTECEEPGCVNWAMPDGRCHHLHGGSDEL